MKNIEIAFNTESWLLEKNYFNRYDPKISCEQWIEENIFKTSNYDWKSYIECRKKFIMKNHGGFVVRAGKNIGPWDNKKIIDMFDLHMPVKNKNYKKSFSDVTDERCASLYKSHKNKPWYVLWSGGTDSTVIVSAILKNIPVADREHIHIACNPDSIFDNPVFFFKFIKPNFKIIDSKLFSADYRDLFETTKPKDSIIIDGNLSDQIFRTKESYQIIRQGISDINPKKSPDVLIKFYKNLYSLSSEAASWWYDSLRQNIESVDLPISTLCDWSLWSWFNFYWGMVKLRTFEISNMTYKNFLSNYFIWYDTLDYQQWALSTTSEEKIGKDIYEYKRPAKDYIFQLDKNIYYYYFKQKGYSDVYRKYQGIGGAIAAIAEDGSILRLDKDIDQILMALPKHLNRYYV